MKIKKLEITNWGPHKKRTFEFDSNIVGIIGANGRGKSNLLQAIDYALTGNLNKQKQEKYIRDYGQPGGASSASVYLMFEKDGKECEITRTITATGSRRKLVWDGSEWTKAADVDAVMETILGADKASLAQAVFVKQGELARIVKGTPAERQTIFQKLMNLGFLEACPDDISAKIGAIRGSIQDMRPALELAKQDVLDATEKQKELEHFVQESEKLKHSIPILESIANTLLENNNTVARLQEAKSVASKAQIKLELVKAKLQGETIEALNAKFAAATDELQNIDTLLATYRKHKVLKERQTEAEAKLAAALNVRNGLPARQDIAMQIANIGIQLNTLTVEVNQLQTLAGIVKSFEEAQAAYNTEEEALKVRQEESKKILEIHQSLHDTKSAERAQLLVQISQAKARLLAVSGPATLCPICGTPLTLATLLLPGESAEDAKVRLQRDSNELDAQLQQKESELSNIEFGIAVAKQKAAPDRLNLIKKSLDAASAQRDKLDPEGRFSLAALQAKQAELNAAISKKGQLDNTLQHIATADVAVAHATSIVQAGLQELAQLNIDPTAMMAVDEASLAARRDQLIKEQFDIRSLTTEYNNAYTAAEDAATNVATLSAKGAHLMTSACQQWEAAESDPRVVECWCSIDPEEQVDRMVWESVCSVISALRESSTEAAQGAAMYGQLELDKHNKQRRVIELQQAVDANEEKLRLIDDLNIVKSMVARTGVPLAFMNDVFHKLVGLVQEMLARMESNFTVMADPDHACSFLFSRTDDSSGFVMGQEQLSGGQAIRLSLAMLLACQQIILPEVGLLVLDEPSSHIDKEGVERMRDLFLSLQQVMTNTNMQILVVDHNDRLATAFETTVVL